MLATPSESAPPPTAGPFGFGLLAEAVPDYGCIVIGVLIGAFGGFLIGLMATQVLRFVGLLVGRNFNDFSLVMPFMFLGALLYAWSLTFGK